MQKAHLPACKCTTSPSRRPTTEPNTIAARRPTIRKLATRLTHCATILSKESPSPPAQRTNYQPNTLIQQNLATLRSTTRAGRPTGQSQETTDAQLNWRRPPQDEHGHAKRCNMKPPPTGQWAGKDTNAKQT